MWVLRLEPEGIMAHEIDTTTGRAAVIVAGMPAWHRLGTNVAEVQTSADAIRLAALDWQVEQWPLVARRDGIEHEVPGRVANVRSDDGGVLGTVGRDYRVFQNADAFGFMDDLVGEKLAMYETAGAIRGGRVVWMMARLPRTVWATDDDPIRPYLLLCNTHDGSRALRLIPTSVRTVCSNTLHLALRQASSTEGLTIGHKQSLAGRVKEARDKLGLVTQRVDEFETQVRAMARRSMTGAKLGAYFAVLVAERAEAVQKKLLDRFAENFDDDTNTPPGMKGSLWAALNAATEWADHQSVVRGKTEVERADHRLNSVWFGSAAEFKQRAFDAAIALAA